jgi:predicted glycogen debranching enzyme
MSAPGQVHFGREVSGRLEIAEEKEWLVTNGLGGFASGTIAGEATRRYHGLLIAALHPPAGRVQLVAALDETARYAGNDYALATHRWASGAVDPQGFRLMESFSLDGTTPVWQYALADAVLEKRIFMRRGENTTYVQYTLLNGGPSLELNLKALVNYRDFHSSTHAGDWRMNIEAIEHGAKVTAFDGATPFYLRSANATAELHHEWYRSCFFSQERARGLDDNEDHLFAVNFYAVLKSGSSISIVVSTQENALLDAQSVRQELIADEHNILRLGNVNASSQQESLPNRGQLLLAADQFIVKRALPEEPEGRSIIAGYHWFGDWGRDTMIALPGLALCAGRSDVARQILLAFSRYIDQGMLPNNFPDAGGSPEYNTIDASLWYFEAIRQYHEVTGDTGTAKKLFPVLVAITDAHVRGTRYDIHVDPADGLLYGGGPGVQLTWMDAKIGDWIVTPRTGKPVEINALWINALHTLSVMARILRIPADAYEQLESKATRNFQRFWNEARSCCFDVIDAPGIGNDATLRPNQIFAASLPVSPLSPQRQKSVVDICARELLTPIGLRSLAPSEPGYIGHYGGTPQARDAAYHQGTVWAWLLGPFAVAHFRVYKDAGAARKFLEPLAAQVFSHGVGSISEIFDAEPPFAPNGCIAQAWSVAELLRAWQFVSKT